MMARRICGNSTFFVALFLFLVSSSEAKPRNILFFLVDDLGWADVGCNGSTFHETPNIDALAESGMRFTNGYAAASICSPTRASIMTGKHPARLGITDWIPGASPPKGGKQRFLKLEDHNQLALEEVTIAEKLKENGYATFFAGKWHLGDEGFWPEDQGFDINIGGHDRGSPPGGYYAPWKNPRLEAKEKGEYLTERLTEESIQFLADRDPEKPFLLYLSYYNVHTPIQPYEKEIEHFRAKAAELFPGETPDPIPEKNAQSRSRQDNPEFASMVAAVDQSVGAILRALEDEGLAETTAVFFFSDNGGLCTRPDDGKDRVGPTSNLPLRAGKGWLYEGGIREATLVRVPGVTTAGSVCIDPVMSTDFFPTILELADLVPEPELHPDGESLMPLLRGGSWKSPRSLHWHYPHYHGSGWAPGAAIRDGRWKLIEFWEYDEVELYDLALDERESENLATENPEKVKELQEKLSAWQKDLGAAMPEPNPDFSEE
jgi:arylsulfatase A-like enzyme